MMPFYTGVVENRDDPLKLGRCQVRIVGLHTEDKNFLPTEDLPWAYPLQPITSAALNGIGYTPLGVVPGTTVIIIFRDEDLQHPIMIGTFGGIPQSQEASLVNNKNSDIIASDQGFLISSDGTNVTSSDGTPVTVGSSESSNNPKAKKSSENTTPVNIFNINIPTTPPPKSTNNVEIAKKNIEFLIKACDKVGLTSKYAKCAILGICGGESRWEAKEESHIYSDAKYLSNVFKLAFKGDVNLALPYTKANYKGTKQDWFRYVYAPNRNGKLLGHKDPDDGAKYYGRGFNQITGKSLYNQLQNELKKIGIIVDFVGNPASLISDPETSALATAMFYKLNVKHDQNSEGYFVAALGRTGAAANSSSYKLKKEYYEYFLGKATSIEPTNKPQADENKVYTKEEVAAAPANKQSALSENRTINSSIGFTDPLGKYPLRHLMDEPDTNRLARGVTEQTAISFKDATRVTEIPMANDVGVWEQPIAPFGGQYPYNKVYESESGHLQTFDDTPGNETLSWFHRKGTYTDIDANGTQVNKIVGDSYQIIDRNGFIYIAGSCNVTIAGYTNVKVMGSADIEVDGQTTINLNNDADIGVAGDLTLAVGGNMDVKVDGVYSMTADGGVNISTPSNIEMQANGNLSTKSLGNTFIDAGGNMDIISGSDTKVSSGSDMHIKGGSDLYSSSGGTSNYKAGGTVLLDGTYVIAQEGMSTEATKANTAPSVSFVGLSAPDRAASVETFLEPLQTPERDFSNTAAFESPEEFNTKKGAYELSYIEAVTPPAIKTEPVYKGVINDSHKPTLTSNKQIITPTTLPLIKTSKSYNGSFTLSKHFNLSNLGAAALPVSKTTARGTFTREQLLNNLAYLSENILEKIYGVYGGTGAATLGGAQVSGGKWRITSGYRNGSGRSEHLIGCAVDFQMVENSAKANFELAKTLTGILTFNQYLMENLNSYSARNKGRNSYWNHCSFNPNGNKMEFGTMTNDGIAAQAGFYHKGVLEEIGKAK